MGHASAADTASAHPANRDSGAGSRHPGARRKTIGESLGVLNPQSWLPHSPASGPGRGGRNSLVDRVLDLGIYVALVGLFIYFWQASPYFLSQRNLLNIGSAVAVEGVLAAGMTVALIAGQLDLTVGANLAITSVVGAVVIEDLHWGTVAAVVVGLGVGAVIGVVNSLLVVGVRINSIIATLALGLAIRAVALIVTDGQGKQLTDLTITNFVNARPLGIPVPVGVLIAVFLVSWVVMTTTRAGWHIYGLGGNHSAAVRSGIRTKRLHTGVFLATGLLAAVGGILTLGTSASGGPNYGDGMEFDVLTAVLLGGIGLSGGSGKLQRTLAGVLVIGILNNGLTLLSVSSYYQKLASGSVFVLAVVMGAIAERRRAR